MLDAARASGREVGAIMNSRLVVNSLRELCRGQEERRQRQQQYRRQIESLFLRVAAACYYDFHIVVAG